MSELPKPIAVTKDTVVLTRAGWKAILEVLEDATARAAVNGSLARQKAGHDDGLSADLYRRLRGGEHPIRVWRTHRKLSLNALAERASIARAYLSEIETGKKPGSVAALQRIARVLRVEIDDLIPARVGKAANKKTRTKTPGE
jgi:DNA-binding Xre family transcriptional regulator